MALVHVRALLNISYLTKPRQRRERERQKAIGLNEQNNNLARASRFLVRFFGFTAKLRREMTKF